MASNFLKRRLVWSLRQLVIPKSSSQSRKMRVSLQLPWIKISSEYCCSTPTRIGDGVKQRGVRLEPRADFNGKHPLFLKVLVNYQGKMRQMCMGVRLCLQLQTVYFYPITYFLLENLIMLENIPEHYLFLPSTVKWSVLHPVLHLLITITLK